MELLDALLGHGAVALAEGDLLAFADGAAVHAADGDASHVAAVVEAGDEHLRVPLVDGGSRDVLHYGVEHGGDVVGGFLPVVRHPALFGGPVDHREVKLLFGGVEVEHQVEDHFGNLFGAAVGFVHLVDDNHGFEAHLYGFLEDEACLGHGPLEGVDEQQASVGHVEHAFHLAAEVGVSRGVDDVDFCPFVVYGDVFGEDGDAAFTFQVVVVEYKFAGVLVVAEEMAGHKHLVDEGGFTVVDMRYDGDISDVLHKSM